MMDPTPKQPPPPDLTALRDELVAFTRATPEQAENALATIVTWWNFPVEQFPQIIQAIAGRPIRRRTILLWLHWTATLAAEANFGELVFFAAMRVAAERGVAAKVLDALQAHVHPSEKH